MNKYWRKYVKRKRTKENKEINNNKSQNIKEFLNGSRKSDIEYKQGRPSRHQPVLPKKKKEKQKVTCKR